MADHEDRECADAMDPEWKQVDFSTFVLSLGTSVLYHLGQAAGPEGTRPVTNLPLARQVIDILAMLKQKTGGNLTEDEEKLLDALLFDLRLKFVDACRGAAVTPEKT